LKGETGAIGDAVIVVGKTRSSKQHLLEGSRFPVDDLIFVDHSDMNCIPGG
jgi:hypothetical protein